MKKPILILLLLVSFLHSRSQNWQCVNSNELRYFSNDEHYLRAIKIDSLKVSVADTILYPFRSERGDASNGSTLQVKGSWLGDKIIIQPDGTNLFINNWGDSIIINTFAGLNEYWMFYEGKDATHFAATVSSVDTMTILNQLDSIKIINITATLTTHPAHGRTIIISKNHGIIKTFELFLFPYQVPGTGTYWVSANYDEFFNKANPQTLEDFELIYYYNPTKMELFNYKVGDILQYHESKPFQDVESYISNEVLKKTVYNGYIEYEIISDVESIDRSKLHQPPYQVIYSNSKDTTKLIADTSRWLNYLPENKFAVYTYYIPDDTSFCKKSSLYISSSNAIFISLLESHRADKMGIGTLVDYSQTGGGPIHKVDKKMTFYSVNNDPCRTPKWPAEIEKRTLQSKLSVYPNPSNDIVNIKIDNKSNTYQLIITDVMGKTVYKTESNKEQLSISVNNIPAGLYHAQVRLNEEVLYEKIIVQH